MVPVWWENLVHVVIGRAGRHTDLPDLPSRPVAVERTHYVVHDRERQLQGRRLYVLRREPRSRRDVRSIAVYSHGRGVGYLPLRTAALLSPLLDRLGGAAVVNGSGTRRGSIRLWVDVPTEDALRDLLDAPPGPRDEGTGG